MASLPASMKAWKWSGFSGKFENRLKLQPNADSPVSHKALEKNEILIQVLTSSLNPVDYKMPEMRFVARFLFSTPSIPGYDFCGRVVAVGPDVDTTPNASEDQIDVGKYVFGDVPELTQFGSLGEYVVVPASNLAVVPHGVHADQAAAIGIAGQTAYQSLLLHGKVKPGDRIFINGGSSGCGVFGIQIAKALGCHVTTSCSSRNMQFVKGLGADAVLDYTKESIIIQLKRQTHMFDFIADFIADSADLYRQSHHYLKPGKVYSQVAPGLLEAASNMLLPGILGGGRRKWQVLITTVNKEHLSQLARWVQQGKIKVPFDSIYEFEEAPQAFEKLKTKRARGKVIVHVTSLTSEP